VQDRTQVPGARRAGGRHGGDDDDHPAVLRGDQDVPVAEPLDDGPLQCGRRAVDRTLAAVRRREGHVVRPAEVDAERLGALHHPRDVGVPAEQVVDELAPQGLLVADHLPPLGLVTVDEYADGVVEDAQHRLGGPAHLLRVAGAHHDGQLPPEPPRRGQVQVDRAAGADALRGRPPPQLAHRVELPRLGTAAVDGGVGQHRQVVAEQVDRGRAGRRGRRRDRGEPVPARRRPARSSRRLGLLVAHGSSSRSRCSSSRRCRRSARPACAG
jgi:hypothetical protein